jgi:hypothetical protein
LCDSETEYYIILSGSGTVNDNGTERGVIEESQIRKAEVDAVVDTGATPLVIPESLQVRFVIGRLFTYFSSFGGLIPL